MLKIPRWVIFILAVLMFGQELLTRQPISMRCAKHVHSADASAFRTNNGLTPRIHGCLSLIQSKCWLCVSYGFYANALQLNFTIQLIQCTSMCQ